MDDDVPHALSAAMAVELQREHARVTVPGAGHGLSGGDPQLVAEAHQKAADFIRTRLKEGVSAGNSRTISRVLSTGSPSSG